MESANGANVENLTILIIIFCRDFFIDVIRFIGLTYFTSFKCCTWPILKNLSTGINDYKWNIEFRSKRKISFQRGQILKGVQEVGRGHAKKCSNAEAFNLLVKRLKWAPFVFLRAHCSVIDYETQIDIIDYSCRKILKPTKQFFC